MGGRMVDALQSSVGGLEILKHVSPLPSNGLFVLSVCPNGVLDNSKYPSPMPTIGLYIALGTLVCFLFILFDLCYGFYRRTPWLPCKLFSMNSFTMTLISIATKLSVDLNTPMPRAMEQLSKLTSSAFLCVAMGFLMPSFPTSRTSESIANVAALSLVVITVVVNVSIQISTGVIFSFIVEHVILLICMSVLLLVLCSSTLYVNFFVDGLNHEYTEKAKETPSEGGLSGMRKQLEDLYKVGCANPQLLCCETSYCSNVGLICSLVVAVVLEASLRSLIFKELRFCNGVSDYKSSITWVIVIQILTITICAFVVLFRWLIMVSHRSIEFGSCMMQLILESASAFVIITSLRFNPLHFKFHNKRLLKLYRILRDLVKTGLAIMNVGVVWASLFVLFLCLMVRKLFSLVIQTDVSTSSNASTSFNYGSRSFYNDNVLDNWIFRITTENLERLIDVSKRDALTHRIAVLYKTLPQTMQQLPSLLSIMQQEESDEFTAVSQFSMIVLTKIASYSMSNSLGDSLKEALHEALELINFVENKMKVGNFAYKSRQFFTLGERFMELGDCIQINVIDPAYEKIPNHIGNSTRGGDQEADLRRALLIIEGLRDLDVEEKSRYIICDSILKSRNAYSSISDLSDYIEQAFVDILCSYLRDLPMAIYKEYSQSSIEECEASISKAYYFICVLELLEDKISLSSWPGQLDTNSTSEPNSALPATTSEECIITDPLGLDEAIQEIQSENVP